ILGAIVKLEPDWSLIPSQTPSPIISLLRHCLQKDSKRRLHFIADAKFAIEEARSAPTASALYAKRSSSNLRVYISAAILVLLAAVAILVMQLRRTAIRQPQSVFSISPPEQIPINEVTVSPDGDTIAFTSQSQTGIWIRRLNALDAVKLPG